MRAASPLGFQPWTFSAIKTFHRVISGRECRTAAVLFLECNYESDQTDLTSRRSVPTKDEILVPETVLKKRKSQEKEREQRAAELEKKRKVSQYHCPLSGIEQERYSDDTNVPTLQH